MAEALVNSAVRVSALRKRYGKLTALETVDLAVAPGEAFGLVGANGAGKTTLIKCLLDLCAYESGTIRIFGQPAGEPQQRGLGAAFLVARDLYVLDEPMSGLDPAARVAVKSVLRRLAAEGRTLFFTSHVLADVEELCSSIAVLEQGRVRWHGSPEGLRAKYGEARLEQAFMRCIRGE